MDPWVQLVLIFSGYTLLRVSYDSYQSRKKTREQESIFFGSMNIKSSTDSKADLTTYKFDEVMRENIIGLDAQLDRIEDDITILNNITEYKKKCNLPRGVMLSGDPGVGKTLLARYMFSKINGSVIRVAKTNNYGMDHDVASTFEKARSIMQNSGKPVIIFRDEIGADHNTKESAELLEELSGINSNRNQGVFFIGTTNIEWVEEVKRSYSVHEYSNRNSPLYRPGRLEIIEVPSPTLSEKEALLSFYFKKNNLTYTGDCIEIASLLPTDKNGAFIELLAQKVTQQMILRSKTEPLYCTPYEMIEIVHGQLMGLAHQSTMSEQQLRRVATHEIGHYTLAKHFHYPISFVSIDHFGSLLGYAQFSPSEKDLYPTTHELEERIQILMGGYRSEALFYPKHGVSLGSLKDIDLIHKIMNIHTSLTQRHKPLGEIVVQGLFSEATIPQNHFARHTIRIYEGKVDEILLSKKHIMETMIEYLLSKKTVYAKEFERLEK